MTSSCATRSPVASVLIAALFAAAIAAMPPRVCLAQAPLAYPPAHRGTGTVDVAGAAVADPYAWLENTGSGDVRVWVTEQNALTDRYLANAPDRERIAQLLRSRWRPTPQPPFSAGERVFFYQDSALANQPALYVRDRPELPPRPLLEPTAFSNEGLIAVVAQAASPDGRYLAYAVSTQGSSWRTVRVRDVRTAQDLPEELQGVRNTPLAWTHDSRGFFYIRSDIGRSDAPANPLASQGREQILYHRAGHRQSDDQLIFDASDHPQWRLGITLSDDGEYLVIAARAGAEPQNRLYFVDLADAGHPSLRAPLVRLFDLADATYDFVSSYGPLFFIRTDKDAPHGRLVAVDINDPDEARWTTVVRETYDPLVGAIRVDDRLVVHRLHDAHSVLELHALDGGNRGAVTLPGVGTVSQLTAGHDRQFYFTFQSFLEPPVVYRYDLDARLTVPAAPAPAAPDTTLSAFETTQLFFTSGDGTRVPMFITARRGITLDGAHATLLAADGTFGRSMTPAYSPAVAAWLEMGGIYAVANVRGGGEYGRAWRDAGSGMRRQTAVNDLLAAAQFLVDQRYTRSSLLAVTAQGAGALVAGDAIARRPELFAAALFDAGLLDLATLPQFGAAADWQAEFGWPQASAAHDARALLALSPLEQVRAGVRYPATLLTVGENDDVTTIVPTLKFAAALQWAEAGAGAGAAAPPVELVHVEYNAGHGPGTPTAKELAVDGDRLAFLAATLGAPRDGVAKR
jgi:prolyl oligopeptidase